MKRRHVPEPCPCGGALYAQCCGPLHQGVPAPTAEALMRSRYSAYVRGDVDYLIASWHPSTRPDRATLQQPGPTWLGLDVRRHTPIDAQHAGPCAERMKALGYRIASSMQSRLGIAPFGPYAP